MPEYFAIELKEAFNGNLPYSPPKYPRCCGLVIGITYQEDSPKEFITTEKAYQMALDATYHRWLENVWHFLGNAEELLKCIVQVTIKEGFENWEYSWPKVYENHYTFNRSDSYQVNPVRELLRRHFNQEAYVGDIDIIIDTTYRRRSKS